MLILCKRKIPSQGTMLDDFGTETREIILCLNANGISQMFIMTLLTEHEGGFPIPGWDWVYNRHQSILEADRRRFPSRKHFKGRMAAKGVFSPLSSSLPV